MKRGLIVFAFALILQMTHMVEHFAQLYQFLILRLPIFEAHGIIFFLDLEYNHFTFNLIYFLLLSYAFIMCGLYNKQSFISWKDTIYRWIFLSGFAIAAYHVLEHTARIGQMLQTGCTPCPGILGWYFNGIYLHYTLNTLMLALPLIAFFGLGYHKEVRQIFKQAAKFQKNLGILAVGLLMVLGFNHAGFFKFPAAKAVDCGKVSGEKTVDIGMMDDKFEPADLTVSVCDTLNFINMSKSDRWPGAGPHPTHTSYPGFDSKRPVKPGQTFEFKVNRPGNYSFHDHLHEDILGTVRINP